MNRKNKFRKFLENSLHRKNLFRKTYIFGALNRKNKFRKNFSHNQFLPPRYQIANGKNFTTKELAKYQTVFSKTTEKANLIYQKLKKRRNRLEKKAKKLIGT